VSDLSAPYFEDLHVGLVERRAPAVTLTDGMAALHQAIVGGRLALALDATLARAVAWRSATTSVLVCSVSPSNGIRASTRPR